MSKDPRNLPQLPHSPGVYLMRDNTSAIVYIGKAKDLKKRVASYFLKKNLFEGEGGTKTQALVSAIRHIDYVPTASEREALILERKLISEHKPIFNVMWKDDKTYPMICLTMSEDFPRLTLTREAKKKGNLYFGPYPTVSRVKDLLRWTWKKKLFPLRPCDYEFSETNLLPYEKVRSCLYLHTGECTAPCIGKISSQKYKVIAKRAKWFFEGKEEKMVSDWKKEMQRYSNRLEYEKAKAVRDRIITVELMNENVTFRQMNEENLQRRIQQSRGTQELMRALGMAKSPEVIECFDISHFQGVEKVASMVRFQHGRADKSQYRKFIIRTVEGIDDFKSMAEVVGRRYRRLKAEGRPYPDLILIDGGKGQLSSALQALMKEDIKGPAIAALAKEEEELFIPGRSESIRLPFDSPALLLVRQVRDEAHRFAISFHRLRRSKLYKELT